MSYAREFFNYKIIRFQSVTGWIKFLCLFDLHLMLHDMWSSTRRKYHIIYY